MNAVFVDTGYLFALEITNDQHHQAARQHWQGIVAALPRLVTTSYVFDEVVTFFNSRGSMRRPSKWGTICCRAHPYNSSMSIRRYFTKGGRISSAIRTRITPSRIVSPFSSCRSWVSGRPLPSISTLSKRASQKSRSAGSPVVPPNKGLQPTAYSLRSCLAPAARRA